MISHNKQTSERSFNPDELVLIKKYHHGPTWIPGEVLTGGPHNYKIKLANGAVISGRFRGVAKGAVASPPAISGNIKE